MNIMIVVGGSEVLLRALWLNCELLVSGRINERQSSHHLAQLLFAAYLVRTEYRPSTRCYALLLDTPAVVALISQLYHNEATHGVFDIGFCYVNQRNLRPSSPLAASPSMTT